MFITVPRVNNTYQQVHNYLSPDSLLNAVQISGSVASKTVAILTLGWYDRHTFMK